MRMSHFDGSNDDTIEKNIEYRFDYIAVIYKKAQKKRCVKGVSFGIRSSLPRFHLIPSPLKM